jgi:hypothetical protein
MLDYVSEDAEIVWKPLAWQRAGLRETKTGYGLRLTSPWKVNHNGRLYRIYVSCVSNAASGWIKCNGKKIFIRHSQLCFGNEPEAARLRAEQQPDAVV